MHASDTAFWSCTYKRAPVVLVFMREQIECRLRASPSPFGMGSTVWHPQRGVLRVELQAAAGMVVAKKLFTKELGTDVQNRVHCLQNSAHACIACMCVGVGICVDVCMLEMCIDTCVGIFVAMRVDVCVDICSGRFG